MTISRNLQKPARDLVQNWSIDVAAELEAYLSNIETTTAGSQSNDETELNFVEAALLLQSTTSVYSRKVEYLRSIAYETLQNFATERRTGGTDKQTGGENRANRKGPKAADDWDICEAFFVPWNAVKNKVAPNSQGHEQISLIRTSASSVPQRIPLVLVPRDDRNDSRLSSATVHHGTGALFVDSQNEALFSDLCPAADVNILGLGSRASYHKPSIGMSVLPTIHSQEYSADYMSTPHVSPGMSKSAFPTLVESQTSTGHRSSLGSRPSVNSLSRKRDDGDDSGGEADVMQNNLMNININGPSAVVAGAGVAGDERGSTAINSEGTGPATTVVCIGPDGSQTLETSALAAMPARKARRTPTDLLKPLDCHKPCGRQQPIKVGRTWKAPIPSVYNVSITGVSDTQLSLFASGGLAVLLSSHETAGTFDPTITADPSKDSKSTSKKKSNQSMPNEDSSTTAPPSSGDVLQNANNKANAPYGACLPQNNRLVPGFPDIRRPALPSELMGLGGGWSAIESHLWKANKKREARAVQRRQHRQTMAANSAGYQQNFLSQSTPDSADTDATSANRDANAAATGDIWGDHNDGDDSDSGGLNQGDGADLETVDDGPGGADVAELGLGCDKDRIERALFDAQSSYSEVLQKRLALLNANEREDELNGSLELSQLELHKRISDWRHRVDDWMIEVEARGPFDIEAYKKRITTKVDSPGRSKASSKSSKCTFADVVKGEKRHEICRLFLATLMLSNQEVLDVKPPERPLLALPNKATVLALPSSRGPTASDEKENGGDPAGNFVVALLVN